ncbi:MAG TPA: hypothetical protein VK423_01415 [Thermoplasmata archaeon]|nr:hypothetical protein [Thermoplasmata archaeon]
MLRETTFWIGGFVTIALGVALALGLFVAGAGAEYLDAWLSSGVAVGFGAFFVHVAREERRERQSFLATAEKEPPEKPTSGPR